MLAKARETFRQAAFLRSHAMWDGAAQRLYYALYQAAVAGFERQGRRPSDFRTPRHPAEAGRWPHATIRRHIALLGVRDARVMHGAYDLRIQADYKAERVDPKLLARLWPRATQALRLLGVPSGAQPRR